MTETQKRIKAYKEALPHMRERVIAVALLLVIAITMVTSATFAWVTLSKTPEVSSLSTTISTNGNLEIALSDEDGEEPDPTAIGDGGQDIVLSNLTWGNLVNLSDERYGLEYITLRPASLKTDSLTKAPLESVVYGADGRIQDTISDFAFTNFEIQESGAKAFFVPKDGKTHYGVRAISSVVYSTEAGQQMLVNLKKAVDDNKNRAVNGFKNLAARKDYMSAITGLAEVYLAWRLSDDGNGGNVDQSCNAQVENLYNMMKSFKVILEDVGNTLLAIANLHHYFYCDAEGEEYKAFTIAELNDGTVKTRLAAEGITLTAMDIYLDDIGKFDTAFTATEGFYNEYKNGGTVWWTAISPYVNIMADVPSTKVNGTAASGIGPTEAMGMMGGGDKECVVQKGLIKDMDEMLGTPLLRVTGLSITVRYLITVTVNVNVSTAAQTPFPLIEDVKVANQKADEGGLSNRDAVAADTYGMAIDFWVRTNAANSELVLEGELKTETRNITDADGNIIYDENGNPYTETVVVGYEGVNRVWEEGDPELPLLGPSTTQGSGSCYVFYPDSPEEKAQSLELLSAMKVAFISEGGEVLASANMDTVNVIEQAGRILVPLQLSPKLEVVGQEPMLDEDGNEMLDEDGQVIVKDKVESRYYVTKLTQNEAQRITAIIYVDGTTLSNEQVLAAGSIKGQLNIQFGTSEDVVSIDDPELKDDFYNITLSADRTEFDTYDPATPPKVNLTLTLNGMEASSIRGNLVSYISSTQGASQPSFSFTKGEGSTWTAEVTLYGAGNYQLRSVQIDGVDYPLDADQIFTLVVPGTAISSVSCVGWTDPNNFAYKTANGYYTLKMNAQLTGTSPRTVQGVFTAGTQVVTADFVPTNNGWEAEVNFTSSGVYTMEYMYIDGAPVPLPESQHKTMELTLGMRTNVIVSRPVNAAYLLLEEELAAAKTEAEKTAIQSEMDALLDALYYGDPADPSDSLELVVSDNDYQFFYTGGEPLFMDVSCQIADDAGNPMNGMSDVFLHYGIGSAEANHLESAMVWNSQSSRYEGRIQLTKPGIYGFQYLEVGTDRVETASYARTIRAISPNPISYAGPSILNETYHEEISANPSRNMGIVLKDSPSAEVVLVMEHSDSGVETTTYELPAAMTYENEADGTFEYTAGVPTDGTWKIVGMKVRNVFYNGTYFDGVDVSEGGTGWADLSDKVRADNIETTFFTTVNLTANASPSGMHQTDFMVGKSYSGISVSITDYLGRPIEGAALNLNYVWGGFSTGSGITANNEANLPNKTLGKSELVPDGNGKYAIGDLLFQLDGMYQCDFSVNINGVSYPQKTSEEDLAAAVKRTFTSDLRIPNAGATAFVPGSVTIRWNQLDVVRITAVSPEGSSFALDDTDAENVIEDTSTGSGCDEVFTTHSAHKMAGAHSYTNGISDGGKTATVYIACTEYSEPGDDHIQQPSQVTLSMNAVSGVTKANLVFAREGGGDVRIFQNMSSGCDAAVSGQKTGFDFSWGSGDTAAKACTYYIGYAQQNGKGVAGTLKSQSMVLTYGGVEFTLPYTGITIVNER